MNITNMYNQFKTLGERKPNERIIFSNLSFFVCEGGFRCNNRFRETNVSDISIGCHFLKTICQIRKKNSLFQLTQMTENANRSTKGRREQRLVPNSAGNMSIRLSTRYTVVPLDAASLSIGVSGWTKWDTSAISSI